VQWNDFNYGGRGYDLSHLHPRVFRFARPAEGASAAEVFDVEVRFTLHCFSRGLRDGEVFDRFWSYPDDYETRIVDFRRDEMSNGYPRSFRDCRFGSRGTIKAGAITFPSN
jgi:hypothetical protein